MYHQNENKIMKNQNPETKQSVILLLSQENIEADSSDILKMRKDTIYSHIHTVLVNHKFSIVNWK